MFDSYSIILALLPYTMASKPMKTHLWQ